MSNRPRQMKLAVVLSHAGAHPAGWRHPAAQSDLHDIKLYAAMAQSAERAKFDAFFLADAQGFRHIVGRDAYVGTDNGCKLEPVTMLAALAMVTERIGLIATCSTTYNEPYAIARRFASLDHISGGRAGWNVVTSTTRSEARNFGLDKTMEHDRRYDRAGEFIDVVNGLWDSWEADAVIGDKQAGRFFDPDKGHALEHVGEYFQVAGPLNVGRSPQGRPIVVQAGASGPGKLLAARTADICFTSQPTLQNAQAFYSDLKQSAISFGRDPESIKVMPAMQILVRGTEAEAKRAQAELGELITTPLAVSLLQMLLGSFDLSPYPLDGPLPEIPLTNGGRSVQKQVIDIAREENLSILELAKRCAVYRATEAVAGTPEQVADLLETWFVEKGADGFALSPDYFPGGVTDFTEQVVPILQKRGLFRSEYEADTLRGNLGLAEPQNMFVAHPEKHHEPEMWKPIEVSGDT